MSYGTYNQQQPMKTFSGQPNWVSESQVNDLIMRVDDLEKQINKEYAPQKDRLGHEEACARCPKDPNECEVLQDKHSRDYCHKMYEQCSKFCNQ